MRTTLQLWQQLADQLLTQGSTISYFRLA